MRKALVYAEGPYEVLGSTQSIPQDHYCAGRERDALLVVDAIILAFLLDPVEYLWCE